MKRLIGFLLLLALISLGCASLTSGPSAADVKATINAGIVQTQAALPQPTEPPAPTQPPMADTPVPEVQPTDAAASGSCPALDLSPKASGIISKITMAEDVKGANKDPVNPTKVFAGDVTIHAVASTKNAPAKTAFKAVWYATDTLGVAACNTKISEFSVATDGTRNIDFTLKPDSKFPVGTYRVEVYVNGKLDSIGDFSIQ